MLPKFLGQVKNGGFEPNDRPRWADFWKFNLKEGQKVTVTIEEKKSTRSLAQNSFYWAFVTIIAHETGNDKEALHELFKRKLLFKGNYTVKGKQAAHEVPLKKHY